MSTPLETFRQCVATVGLAMQTPGPPQGRFATPPWMARRFSEGLILCSSLDDVVDLVAENLRDAAAFFLTASFWLERFETGELAPPELPAIASPEITAAGHVMLRILDEAERQYPEGLTELPELDEENHDSGGE